MDPLFKEQEGYLTFDGILLRGCLVFVENCANALADLADVWEEESLIKNHRFSFIPRLEPRLYHAMMVIDTLRACATSESYLHLQNINPTSDPQRASKRTVT